MEDNMVTDAQGDTGNVQGTEAAGSVQDVVTPGLFDNLPDLKANEALKDITDVKTLAEKYLEAQEALSKQAKAPEDVKGYEIEIPEGYPVDQVYVDAMKAKALELGFSVDQFKALAAAQLQFEQQRAKDLEAYSKELWTKEKQAVTLERGSAAFAEDMAYAKKAITAFFGAEVAENFTNESADPLYFRGFAKIGRLMSADTMHLGGEPSVKPARVETDSGIPMLKYPSMEKKG